MEPAGAEGHRRAGRRPSERERTSQTHKSWRATLKRALERYHSVRSAIILVVTDVGTIKIELPVGLVSDLAGQRHDRRNFPIDSRAGPHLAISDHGVIESRVTRVVAEVIVYA